MNKTGTFRCWLWGHVFVGNFQRLEGNKSIETREPVNFCIRCGFKREEE